MALNKFQKQPGDTQDYDADFVPYLERHNDVIQTVAVASEAGLTVNSFSHALGVVKVWLSGGTDGEQYKISVTATTAGGRIKQHDFVVQVREL